MFELHPQLAKDSFHICDLELCRVLLANDQQYPWLILVPMVADITEVIDLTPEQQQLLWQESAKVSHLLKSMYQPDKLNIAALGNVVPQLHVHHVVRFVDDKAWPAPIWGALPAVPYGMNQAEQIKNAIVTQL